MMKLFEMKQNHRAAIAKAESIMSASEAANRELTAAESQDFDAAMAEAQALAPQIANVERKNTLMRVAGGPMGLVVSGDPTSTPGVTQPRKLSTDYSQAFHAWLGSGGQNVSAALYEGSNTAGGYAVPVTVDDQIVPLAPQEMSLRQIATVLPTTNDIKIPRKTAFGVAAAKAESGATTNTFQESEPTIDQFTLSAFMAGILQKLSWELAQDVPAFQAFAVQDMLLAQQMFEEAWFVSGTGGGQPQGLLGNVGSGVTEEPDANGNLVSTNGILDLIGSLNAMYHKDAVFLMARPTSILLRKAQMQSNLFEPVFTRVGSQDFLYGYPVAYCTSMPAAVRGATPVLFGDFKQGFVIGDRGGSGINVKILDQPFAPSGQIGLIAYRRVDSRVRRSEAIQSYNIAGS